MEERKERKLLKEENRSQPRDSLTSAEQLKSQGETDITLFFFFSILPFFFFLSKQPLSHCWAKYDNLVSKAYTMLNAFIILIGI